MRTNIGLILRVAATYIGTVVGAGFASGQEIMQFFTLFGGAGLIGILLAGLLFCGLGVKILTISHDLHPTSYHQLLNHICGRKLGLILEIFISLFLLGGLSIMFAGTGALAHDYLDLPFNAGLIFTAILTVFTVFHGMNGIMLANSIVVPLLALSASGACIYSVIYHGLNLEILHIAPFNPTVAPHWLLASLLYIGYNLILALTVLVPLGSTIRNRTALVWGGWLGGGVLGILALLLALVTCLHMPQVSAYELPMLHITNQHGAIFGLLYVLILWAEMFTTAISNLYGFAQFAANSFPVSYRVIVLVSTIGVLVLSQLGFSALLTLLYPLFGYISLIFIAALILHRQHH